MKRGKFFAVGFCLLALMFLGSNVRAAIGVAPAYYTVDYEPGVEKNLPFTFYTDRPTLHLEVYTEGDFSKYATLDKTRIEQGGDVTLKIRMPRTPDKYGPNRLYVGAREIGELGEGFGIVGNIRAVVTIVVPYPGRYAEGSLGIKDVKKGNMSSYELKIFNRGSENLNLDTSIEIRDSSGRKVDVIEVGKNTLSVKDSITLYGWINSTGYAPGRYDASAIIKYDSGSSKAETQFRIGELSVSIANYTDEVERNKINRFEITAESFWNDPIENLHAEGFILGHDIAFTTPSTSIDGFGKTTLVGYFDSTNMTEDKLKIKLDLLYGGKRTSKTVEVWFKEAKADRRVLYIALGSMAAILILTGIIIVLVLWILKRENGSKKRKKK